jgi:GNAT superfamily N-acetyltransferase
MTPTTITIRRAGPADATTVHAMVLEIAAHQAQTAAVASTAGQWRDFLHRDDVIVLLAERDGTALGYASMQIRLNLWAGRNMVALDDLYVRSHARNDGVGHCLMTEAARLADPQRRIVRWEVDIENLAAQRFYARLDAVLTTKVIATWTPPGYGPHIG